MDSMIVCESESESERERQRVRSKTLVVCKWKGY